MYVFFLCIIFSCSLSAQQDAFRLANASLEGPQGEGAVPPFWKGCGGNSTSDLMPGPWGVQTPAQEGQSYLGLVTREDGTWEALAQALPQSFKKGYCYRFNVFLAQSLQYSGYHKKPVCLRIWGGGKLGERKQLLCVSPPIEHSEWKAYELAFVAEEDWPCLLIEAYYQSGTLFYYRGNLLIDNFSEFKPCPRA